MKQSTTQEHRAWITWYHAHGCNAAATCRHFEISRSTFYRWLKRYDPAQPQKPLKPQSRRPHTKRKPTWSLHHLAALSDRLADAEERGRFWGRRQWQAALAARGWYVSQATVGRMLQAIKRRCPVCRRKGGRHHIDTHYFRRDMASMGLAHTRRLLAPPPPPKLTAARGRKEALRQAHELLRGPEGGQAK